MTMQSRQLGRDGEEIACRYLEDKGMRIIERNWRCRAGEADVIAYDGDELAFIEVKTRRNVDTGFPEEAVTAEKRRRYEKIALLYLSDHDLPSAQVRFDIVAIIIMGAQRAFVRHHYDAYGYGD